MNLSSQKLTRFLKLTWDWMGEIPETSAKMSLLHRRFSSPVFVIINNKAQAIIAAAAISANREILSQSVEHKEIERYFA